jgi:hypothetical protein
VAYFTSVTKFSFLTCFIVAEFQPIINLAAKFLPTSFKHQLTQACDTSTNLFDVAGHVTIPHRSAAHLFRLSSHICNSTACKTSCTAMTFSERQFSAISFLQFHPCQLFV